MTSKVLSRRHHRWGDVLSFCLPSLKPPHEIPNLDSHHLADRLKLQQIQSPLTAFVIADERLRLTKFLGHVGLA